MTWREFVADLSPAQRDHMLNNLLEWQLDQLGAAGDVRFREPEDEDEDDPYAASLADIY